MTSSLPQLGHRGEGMVALQVVLLAAMLATGDQGTQVAVGVARHADGGGGPEWLGWAVPPRRRHRPPRVADSPRLQSRSRKGSVKSTSAPTGVVRHPMYGGVLLLTLAWSLASSPLALMPWTVAVGFLDAKRRREEAWLVERDFDYEGYRTTVRHSLIPFVW